MQEFLKISSKKLGIDLHDEQTIKLLNYLDLLYKWNKTYNLCAPASYQHMLSYHLLDSISIAGALNCQSKTILDVGSGAGLPGIPLSIVEPSCNMVLLDCKSKKIAFLQHVVHALGLQNITIELSRAEDYLKIHGQLQATSFDLIVSRACVADLADFVKLTARLCNTTGMLIAMKSDPQPFKIGSAVDESYKIIDLKELHIPGVIAKRCLVFIGR